MQLDYLDARTALRAAGLSAGGARRGDVELIDRVGEAPLRRMFAVTVIALRSPLT